MNQYMKQGLSRAADIAAEWKQNYEKARNGVGYRSASAIEQSIRHEIKKVY